MCIPARYDRLYNRGEHRNSFLVTRNIGSSRNIRQRTEFCKIMINLNTDKQNPGI